MARGSRRSPATLLRAGLVDVGPLRRHRAFRRLWLGQLVSMLGRQVTVVALPYQVYDRTGSTLAVGLLGLVQAVPLVTASLLGGAVADRVDRRRVLLGVNALLAVCSSCLAVSAFTGAPPVALLFVVAAAIAALSAVDQPARSATVPNLVTRADLPAAVALMFGLFQVSLVAGPAIGGIVIARYGLGTAYLVDVLTFAAAITAAALLPPQPPASGTHPEPPLRAVVSGLRYLRSRRDIVGSFTIDLDAMIFGMPRALFPALATGVYGTGPQGLGLLYAAPGLGAVLAVAAASGVARADRLGRVVVVAVLTWGTAIAAMGAVPQFGLALVLLAVAGGADGISAVCRSTMVQGSTPDHLRGRVSSAYAMVVMGGPYLGDLESGVVGAATSTAVAVVSGGVLCVLGVGAVVATFPELWRYRAHRQMVASDPAIPAAAGRG